MGCWDETTRNSDVSSTRMEGQYTQDATPIGCYFENHAPPPRLMLVQGPRGLRWLVFLSPFFPFPCCTDLILFPNLEAILAQRVTKQETDLFNRELATVRSLSASANKLDHTQGQDTAVRSTCKESGKNKRVGVGGTSLSSSILSFPGIFFTPDRRPKTSAQRVA